jgi:hypothetical protein
MANALPLHSLNGRFSHMAALLKWQRLFPTFTQVCNDLQLEEIKLMSKPGAPSMALVATTPDVVRTPSPAAPVGAPPPAFNAPALVPKKSNNKNRNQRNNHSMPSLLTPTHPWNGTLQLWAIAAATRSGGPDLFSARPGTPQP